MKTTPKPVTRVYSRHGRAATALLGKLIRSARKERRLTTREVAERAGISRGLLQRIERGDVRCGIGMVFEVAVIVGVKLFDADETALAGPIRQVEEKLALLPKSTRKATRTIDDDF